MGRGLVKFSPTCLLVHSHPVTSLVEKSHFYTGNATLLHVFACIFSEKSHFCNPIFLGPGFARGVFGVHVVASCSTSRDSLAG